MIVDREDLDLFIYLSSYLPCSFRIEGADSRFLAVQLSQLWYHGAVTERMQDWRLELTMLRMVRPG